MNATLRRSIRVGLPDRPGSLAQLTALMARAGINLLSLEVVSREGDRVWDDFELESPGDEELRVLVRSLRDNGYELVGLPYDWPVRDWTVDVVETMAEIIEADEGYEVEERLLASLGTVARSHHALFLSDDPDGHAPAVVSRWENLEAVAGQVDSESVIWSGDPQAITAARTALRPANSRPVSRSSRNRIGGAAFLLGSTPRRGVVIAVGGRPPFLRAEVKRLRRFMGILRPWLLRREAAAT